MLEEHHLANVLCTLLAGLEKEAQSAASIELEDQNKRDGLFWTSHHFEEE